MRTRPARDTYRHGNLRAEAIAAARDEVIAKGHLALSVRAVADAVGVAHRSLYNYFADREALLDAVAEVGFLDLAGHLQAAKDSDNYVARYLGFALANPNLYALMGSRPHATMRERPTLQRAVHLGISEAMHIFARADQTAEQNRRAVMKVLILLRGGLSMHLSGVLDVPGDEGLIAELQAMIRAG
jgi:AcrR family transcriptional regulator